jgi:hypothetical protein
MWVFLTSRGGTAEGKVTLYLVTLPYSQQFCDDLGQPVPYVYIDNHLQTNTSKTKKLLLWICFILSPLETLTKTNEEIKRCLLFALNDSIPLVNYTEKHERLTRKQVTDHCYLNI